MYIPCMYSQNLLYLYRTNSEDVMGYNRIKDSELRVLAKKIGHIKTKIKRFNKREKDTNELYKVLEELKTKRDFRRKSLLKDNPDKWDNRIEFLNYKIKRNKRLARKSDSCQLSESLIDENKELKDERLKKLGKYPLKKIEIDGLNLGIEAGRLSDRILKVNKLLKTEISNERRERLLIEIDDLNKRRDYLKSNRSIEVNEQEFVKCPLCNKLYSQITHTHLLTHGLSVDEFKEMYPDFDLVSPAIKLLISKTLSESDVDDSVGHRSLKGKYYSSKFNKDFSYRSSYELLFIKLSEIDDTVIDLEYEKIRIEDGGTIIIPDFLVIRVDSKTLVEVKAKWSLSLETTIYKTDKMRLFSAEQNYVFCLFSELDLVDYAKSLDVNVFELVDSLPYKLFSEVINENKENH